MGLKGLNAEVNADESKYKYGNGCTCGTVTLNSSTFVTTQENPAQVVCHRKRGEEKSAGNTSVLLTKRGHGNHYSFVGFVFKK